VLAPLPSPPLEEGLGVAPFFFARVYYLRRAASPLIGEGGKSSPFPLERKASENFRAHQLRGGNPPFLLDVRRVVLLSLLLS